MMERIARSVVAARGEELPGVVYLLYFPDGSIRRGHYWPPPACCYMTPSTSSRTCSTSR